MPTSIDVIIPSFRLNPATILPILNLQRPANATVHFYLVADNPSLIPSPHITSLVDDANITLIINAENMGASATRNRGMEAGNSNWILFLDDDIDVAPDILITYANAAQQHPQEIGFIGLVTMPPPPGSFAQAVDANGSMGIFRTALDNETYPWGASANIMIKRDAVGDVRFSSAYPKTGGGEEVEFFLRIREQIYFTNYRCLPHARAEHPWWNNGNDNYTRFYRYGLGNSHLAQRNPKYKWYDFLNTAETLVLTLIAAFIVQFFYLPVIKDAAWFILITIIAEFITNVMRVQRKNKSITLLLAYNVMRLRMVYEWGILWGNLSRGRIAGIGERFSYDGSIKARHFRLNRYKIVKLVLYALLILALLIG